MRNNTGKSDILAAVTHPFNSQPFRTVYIRNLANARFSVVSVESDEEASVTVEGPLWLIELLETREVHSLEIFDPRPMPFQTLWKMSGAITRWPDRLSSRGGKLLRDRELNFKIKLGPRQGLVIALAYGRLEYFTPDKQLSFNLNPTAEFTVGNFC